MEAPPARPRGSTAISPEKQPGGTKPLVYVGLVAGVLVGLAVALFAMREDAPPPAKVSKPGLTESAPGEAATRLEEVRGWRDAELTRYADMRAALEAFGQQFVGTPEVADANVLLAEIDRAHAEIANGAWVRARESAETHILNGRYPDAESELADIAGRFEGTPWFAERGEALVAGERARIAELRPGGGGGVTADPAPGVGASTDEMETALAKGLVAWWSFDETEGRTAADSSGNGHTAEFLGGVERVEGRVGTGAIRLDGTTGNVISRAVDYGRGDYTLAAWFRTSQGKMQAILAATTSGRHGNLLELDSKGKLGFLHRNPPGSREGGDTYSTAMYKDGLWHHVAAVKTGIGMTLYVDGEFVGVSSDSSKHAAAMDIVLGGERLGGGARWFGGELDDVRIYSRAVSENEIKWLSALTKAAVANLDVPSPTPTGGGADAAAAPPTDDGPILWWKFDEGAGNTAKDSSGNGRDGALVGVPKWVSGPAGGALEFDGVDDYVTSGSPIICDTYTFSFWLYRSGDGGANPRILSPTDAHWIIWNKGAGKGIGFYNTPAIAPTAPALDTWEHYAVVYDRVGSMAYIYRDGALVASGAASRAAPTGAWVIGHGENVGSTADTWMGRIDDLRVYNRALSAGEARRLWEAAPASFRAAASGAASGAADEVTRGLVGWWKLDEGSGKTAKDSSGKAPGAKLVGNVKWVAGRSGRGLEFDGKSSHVECGTATGSSPALSVAFWMKADAGKNQMPIDKHADGAGGKGWTVKLRGNGDLWFRVGSKDSRTDTAALSAYAAGKWVHVTCTFGGGTAKVYVGGKLLGRKTGISQTVADTITPLWLGRPSKVSPYVSFGGTLDDLRVYDRVLSAAEIGKIVGSVGSVGSVPPGDGSALAGAKVPAAIDLKAGLAGHWKMNTAAGLAVRDSSGRKKHGTMKGSRWAVSGTTRALVFDGKDDYVELPGDTHDFSGQFSVSLLARFADLAGRRCIIGRHQDSQNFAFVLVAENGSLRCNVRRGRQSGSEAHPTTLVPRKWYHIALVMDAASNATLYVNGIPSKKKKMGNRNNSGSLRIGRLASKYWGCIKGYVDEVRIYGRSLSTAEVAKLAGPRLAKAPPAGVIAKPGAAPGGAGVPLGNLVRNGGFEEKDDRGFAKSWTKGQWGARGAAYSVRPDRSNPHTGASALVVRGFAEGAKPGASTTLRLPPGTYEIRYWVCAAVGKSATVGVSFAGKDLREESASDEWRQHTVTVTIEKASLNSGLALWVSTPNVRVWFDDVEFVWK